MKYRDIIGFSVKKQKFVKKNTIPEPVEPPITELLKEEFGDIISEGPAADYAKEYQKVKHTYAQFWDAVQDFESLLKNKGLGRHAKDLDRQWRGGAEKFYKFFFKMMGKLQ